MRYLSILIILAGIGVIAIAQAYPVHREPVGGWPTAVDPDTGKERISVPRGGEWTTNQTDMRHIGGGITLLGITLLLVTLKGWRKLRAPRTRLRLVLLSGLSGFLIGFTLLYETAINLQGWTTNVKPSPVFGALLFIPIATIIAMAMPAITMVEDYRPASLLRDSCRRVPNVLLLGMAGFSIYVAVELAIVDYSVLYLPCLLWLYILVSLMAGRNRFLIDAYQVRDRHNNDMVVTDDA